MDKQIKITYFPQGVKLTLKTWLYQKKLLRNLPLQKNILSITYIGNDQGGWIFSKSLQIGGVVMNYSRGIVIENLLIEPPYKWRGVSTSQNSMKDYNHLEYTQDSNTRQWCKLHLQTPFANLVSFDHPLC